jgi:large subunit ribosomal protein L17
MRHRNKGNALSRTASHRKAMLSNMACSLIEHKRINTTVAKAKELRMFVEPLITKSKTDSTHSRRMVFSTLKSKDAVGTLFRDVAPKVATREGGYTRIIKLGTRQGDAAEMCMIELVDFNELMLQESKTKTRRSRRGKKKSDAAKSDPAAATEATNEVKAAEPEVQAEEPTAVAEVAEAPVEEPKEEKTPEAEAKEQVVEEPKDEPKASADDKADDTDGEKKEK